MMFDGYSAPVHPAWIQCSPEILRNDLRMYCAIVLQRNRSSYAVSELSLDMKFTVLFVGTRS